MPESMTEFFEQFTAPQPEGGSPEAGLRMAVTAALAAGRYRMGDNKAFALVLSAVCASFYNTYGPRVTAEALQIIADCVARIPQGEADRG